MDIMCETKHRSNARNLTLSSDSQLTWCINYGWVTSVNSFFGLKKDKS